MSICIYNWFFSMQGHHGVHLASWRYDEYGSIIEPLIFIIAAGLLKVAFHHLPNLIESLKHSDPINCCQFIKLYKKLARLLLQILSKLPESCVLIVAGIMGAVIFKWWFHVHTTIEFTHKLFFNVLLPPIIMDSAFSIYHREFLHHLPVITLFATVGTLVNTFAIGGSLLLVQSTNGLTLPNPNDTTNGTHLDPMNAFTFSAMISAVDPVAVLAIFQEIGVNTGLYFLVFGESLLNDGVTIVLYNTMVALSESDHIAGRDIGLAVVNFLFVVFGGFFIGVIIGFISTFIVKFTRHCRELEPLIILVLIYLSFILTECIHWSGIMAILGCGIIQKRYAFRNISKKSFWTIKYGIRTAATFADCVIMIFLGIVSVHKIEIWDAWNTSFALWTCAFCTFFRFFATFLLSGLVNLLGGHHFDKISVKEQFIIGYGGLRGAVGFSLALILSKTNQFKDLFLATVIFMVYFTTFLQGGTIKWVVNLLSIQKAEAQVRVIIALCIVNVIPSRDM